MIEALIRKAEFYLAWQGIVPVDHLAKMEAAGVDISRYL